MKKFKFKSLSFIFCTLFILLLSIIIQSQIAYAATLGDYQYTVSGTNATITGYTGTGGNVTIPDKLNGYTVTSIGVFPFDGCTSLTSVNIPNSVTSIGSFAFNGCTNLTEAKFFGNSPTIGGFTFDSCSANFKVYYLNNKTGFTNPWNGYPTVPFSIATYIVTYNGNGSTGGTAPTDSQTYSDKALVTVIGNTGSIIKTNYNFVGWNTSADGSGEDYAPGTTFAMDAANMILYAKWTINSYNVTFNSNGGSAVADQSVNYNAETSKPADSTMIGYTLDGWYTDDGTFANLFDFTNTPITGDITLYAKWTINNYTITFNSQGGSAVSNKSADYNCIIIGFDYPTKEGYNFKGWYKDSNCTLPWNFETDLVQNNVTLYANWIINKDVNQDSVIDIKDILELVGHYNSKINQTDSNNLYDLNHDGIVDIFDLVLVSKLNNTILTSSLSLNKNTDSLIVGETDDLIATLTPIDASNKSVTWISSNPEIATVDGTGKVTAISAGTVTITVITVDGNKSASCILTVNNLQPVTPLAPNVYANDSTNKVTGMDYGMEYKLDDANYVPYDEALFNTIDFSGNHTLLVRVAASGINPESLNTQLIFTTNLIEVTGIAVMGKDNITNINISGGSLQMIATITPLNAVNSNVSWSTDNSSIATIGSNGLLTAVSNGIVNVTAASTDGSEITGTVSITINVQSNYIKENTTISQDTTITGELIIAPNVRLTVNDGIKLTVNGSIYVYGELYNNGILDVSNTLYTNNYNNMLYGNSTLSTGKFLNYGSGSINIVSTYFPRGYSGN